MQKVFKSFSLLLIMLFGFIVESNASTLSMSPTTDITRNRTSSIYGLRLSTTRFINNNGNIILLKFKPNEQKIYEQIPNNEIIKSAELKLYYYTEYYHSKDGYKDIPLENLYLMNTNEYFNTWDEIGSNALFDIPLQNYDVDKPLASGVISQDRKYKSWSFNDNLDIFFQESFTLAIQNVNSSGTSVYFSNNPYSLQYKPILQIETVSNYVETPVPEPSSMLLGLMGLIGNFAVFRGNKKKKIFR